MHATLCHMRIGNACIHISLFACTSCHVIVAFFARDISHDGWKINETHKYVSNRDEKKIIKMKIGATQVSNTHKHKHMHTQRWKRAKSYYLT